MEYNWAMEKHDYSRIDKLNNIKKISNFWDSVRVLTSKVYSDHSIKRWQILAEARFEELKVLYTKRYDELWRYISETYGTRVASSLVVHAKGNGSSEIDMGNTEFKEFIIVCEELYKIGAI